MVSSTKILRISVLKAYLRVYATLPASREIVPVMRLVVVSLPRVGLLWPLVLVELCVSDLLFARPLSSLCPLRALVLPIIRVRGL